MLTLGIRNIAGSRVRLENQKTGADVHQRGHFYLAESGHFYLATTWQLRIMYIMTNTGFPPLAAAHPATIHPDWHGLLRSTERDNEVDLQQKI